MSFRHILSFLFTVLVVTLPASTAFADGITFQQVGASSSVRASEQRAILWLRDGQWEIHIQPRFERDAGNAAWIVPFPNRPAVSVGNAVLFDQLELITSPVFLSSCWEEHEGGCGTAVDSAGSAPAEGNASVHVWERGSVGELDYVILSTADGDDMTAWLDQEGFAVPDLAKPALADFETEGTFFFAARLSSDLDPDKPLAPVRFRFSPGVEITYPLRLTAAGVPEGSLFSLTLWVITPFDEFVVPASHPTAQYRPAHAPTNREAYDRGVSEITSRQGNAGFAQTYELAAEMGGWRRGERGVTALGRATFDEIGLEEPIWVPELEQMVVANAAIARFDARLSGSAMAEDVRFQDQEFNGTLDNVHFTDLGSCDEEGSCSVSGPARGHEHWLALGILALLALGIRRR